MIVVTGAPPELLGLFANLFALEVEGHRVDDDGASLAGEDPHVASQTINDVHVISDPLDLERGQLAV